ncbi:MAG: tyrosine--tRNA ligase [Elusimicrobiota bacterium]|nr:tyrosine--tRNA ligase [Elusimicrobiota bacterium]
MAKDLEIISRGTEEVISPEELKEKLNRRKPLRVKFGADPTAPDIHLGHTVILQKLKQFQDLGHKIVFIIGDFTARIGDPSGRSEARKPLTDEEIKKNAKTYQKQVFKILDKKETEVVFNSEWLERMSSADVLELSSHSTVAQMLARADFKERFNREIDISILEFLYPLLQAYDSIQVKADVEIGGTDQKFNLLMGRQLQRDFDQKPQVIITMPLLEGTDGVRKMSKSYDNYIGITEPPKEIFGKIMSISDELMVKYYELLTEENLEEVKKMHPRQAKANLAKGIVETYYGETEAEKAKGEFEKVFVKRELPEEIKEIRIREKKIWVVDLLVKSGLAISKNEAKRLISQGSVKINHKRIKDSDMDLVIDKEYIVQVGKRKFRRIVQA